MKIALVYFEETLSHDRAHHSVGYYMLKGWQRFYESSGTQAKPCLLLDNKTDPPDFWNYEYRVLADADPPERQDVLNKVGWMKHQAYDELGKCVVMDIDALLKKSIDDLAEVGESIAMAPDIGTNRDWPWASDWAEAAKKYNAGVLYLNSPEISKRFKQLWTEKIKYLKITYFDEIIFSALLHEMNGRVLDETYNTLWDGEEKDVRVVHFSGERKKDLPAYLGIRL